MMSALTRLHDEAARLLETYTLYKDCNDPDMRRKAHVDLDRFLMENRETAIICIEQVLKNEIAAQLAEAKKNSKLAKPAWYKRLAGSLRRRTDEGGATNDGTHIQLDTPTRDA